MLTSEPQYDFLIGNNLGSEQFNSSGGGDDKLSTMNISMSTSEPQLSRQSIEHLNDLFTDDQQYYDQQVPLFMSTPKPPRKKCKTRGGSVYRSSAIVSPINNKSSFSQPALSMLALTALSLPSLSQNDKTEPLQVSDAVNINNINKENFHIPSPDTNTSRQIPYKLNNKNNPNIAETQLLPSTSVAVVRTSLPSQQSSQTLPSVEAPLFYQFIDTANNDINNFHIPSPDTNTSRQIPYKLNNKNNPNIAETQLLPSTSVAVVRTSLPSQQSSQTLPSVEAPLFYQFIDTANNDINNFHIPSPDTNTSRQIPYKLNNKNNPNIAETQLLPSTSVAVVRTSLPSQQSSQTLPSVEAPLFHQFIDTANDVNNSQNKNNVNNYTDVNEFLWNSNERGPREFHFTGSSGVKNISDDPSCPLSVLKTFLTDDLILNIVKFTNTYVALMKQSQGVKEKLNKTDRSMFKLWVDIDNDDVWMYFCILILMGIIKKPSFHMYWSTDCVLSTPIFSRLMRRDRFEQIRGMMRFSDPLNQSSGSLNKILRIYYII